VDVERGRRQARDADALAGVPVPEGRA
jgi:hypothetical protein